MKIRDGEMSDWTVDLAETLRVEDLSSGIEHDMETPVMMFHMQKKIIRTETVPSYMSTCSPEDFHGYTEYIGIPSDISLTEKFVKYHIIPLLNTLTEGKEYWDGNNYKYKWCEKWEDVADKIESLLRAESEYEYETGY